MKNKWKMLTKMLSLRTKHLASYEKTDRRIYVIKVYVLHQYWEIFFFFFLYDNFFFFFLYILKSIKRINHFFLGVRMFQTTPVIWNFCSWRHSTNILGRWSSISWKSILQFDFEKQTYIYTHVHHFMVWFKSN